MPIQEGPGTLVQRLSIWKTVGLELFMVAITVIPFVPGVQERLVYTRFFYTKPFYFALIACGILLALAEVVFLLVVWRAILRVPVLAITQDTITVLLAGRERTVKKSDVVRMVRLWPGANINLVIRGQRPLALPLWFYDEPALVISELKPLVMQHEGIASNQAS